MLTLKKHAISSTIIVLLIMLWSNNFNSLLGQCVDSQYDALIDFFNSTDGENWRRNTGWGDDCEICTWYGITCDESGNVTEIRLRSNKLSGSIPASIVALSSLKTLVLANNNFNSSLPDALGELPSLETLDIGYSNFTGPIPDGLGNSPSLISLVLSGNPFSGSLPESIGNLSSLEILDIFNTGLGGSLPVSIGDLSSLKELHIGVNNFEGSLPSSIGDLSSLEILEIVLEGFSGSIPENIGSLSSLKYLYIQHTDLEGEIPVSIGNLTNLEELYLNNNLISGEIPSTIGNLTQLYDLYLINNDLQGALPETMGNMQALIRFYGYSNLLEGPLPTSLGQLLNLKVLDLGDNQISGEIPESMGSCVSLETMFLDNNELEGDIPGTFALLSNLKNVDLGNNYLSGCIPQELDMLCGLPYVITEPNCFIKPLVAFCAGDLCYGLIENPVEGMPICQGDNVTISASNDQYDYFWSTGSSETILDIQPMEDTEYTVTATNSYGCYLEDATEVEVYELQTVDLSVELCYGEIYSVGQEDFDSDGYYSVTLQDQNGCDSTVNLTLSVRNQNMTTIQSRICEGEEYLMGNSTYTQEGIYEVRYMDQNGCDSTVILDLEVLEREVIEVWDTVCFGDVYTLFGQDFYYDGFYEFYADNGNECESRINLNLFHNPYDRIIIDTTICSGSSIYFFDAWLSEEGTYRIPYENQYGCDSLVQLNITTYEPIETTAEILLCEGEQFDFNGMQINSQGTYYATLESSLGCDSTVTLNVDVLNIDTMVIDTTLCFGDVFIINGEEFSSPGLYYSQMTSGNNCGDVLAITINYFENIQSEMEVTICEGDTYNFNGTTLDRPGLYQGIFFNKEGCDSTVNLSLHILTPDTTMLNADVCYGGYFLYMSDTLAQTGSYTFVFNNMNGCDSTVIVNLSVEELNESYSSISLCQGESVMVNDIVYMESAVVSDTLTDELGCVAVDYLTIDFIPASYTKINSQICEGDRFIIEGQSFSDGGLHTITLENSMGCDSIVELSLEVSARFDTTIFQQICPGESITIEDTIVTDPGIYSFAYISTVGCDSIIHVDVSIINEEVNSVYATICEGESYILDGTSYYEAGQYTSSIAMGFCTQITELYLTVEPIPTENFVQEICPGSTYNFRGLEFSTEGYHEFSLPSEGACDTLVSLELKFRPVEQVQIFGNEILCEGESLQLHTSGFYTYLWNTDAQDSFIIIEEAGTYSVDVTDEYGCQSSAEVGVSFSSLQISGIEVNDNASCTEPSGSLFINADASLGTAEYSIDGGDTWQLDPEFLNLGGGEYEVVTRITDSACSKAWGEIVYINDITDILYEVDIIQEPQCPGDKDGIAYINIADESEVESITWPDGYKGYSREDLEAGSYNVRIENTAGCVQYAEIFISEPAPINYDGSILSDTTICYGEALSIDRPLPEYDYTWYGPSGYIADTHAITIIDPGTYTVEIADYRGCVVEDSLKVGLISEDFSGIDFLLNKEGVSGVPIVLVDVSWPIAENIIWMYDDDNIIMLDSMENQMIVEFQDTGTYEISLLATIGECSMLKSKEIMIHEGQDELDTYYLLEGYIQDVNVFPNPNSGIFSLRTSLSQEAAVLITIVNTSGNMVYQKNLSGESLYTELIDISSQPPGVYAIIIQTELETRYLTISKN